ncbi:MAG: hypothetical protein ACR2K2_14100 [Mycobacteriales bacterium]
MGAIDGHRLVLDASRDDVELAGSELDVSVVHPDRPPPIGRLLG